MYSYISLPDIFHLPIDPILPVTIDFCLNCINQSINFIQSLLKIKIKYIIYSDLKQIGLVTEK